jgi:hypothetical protein
MHASAILHCIFISKIFTDAAGVKDVDAKWIGWAGVNVPDEVGQRALTRALAEKVRRCNSGQISLSVSTLKSEPIEQ